MQNHWFWAKIKHNQAKPCACNCNHCAPLAELPGTAATLIPSRACPFYIIPCHYIRFFCVSPKFDSEKVLPLMARPSDFTNSVLPWTPNQLNPWFRCPRSSKICDFPLLSLPLEAKFWISIFFSEKFKICPGKLSMSAAQICNSFQGKSVSHKSFPTLEKDNFRISSSGDMTIPIDRDTNFAGREC